MMQIIQTCKLPGLASPIRFETQRDGQIERIILDRPPGNILDLEMFAAIRARLAGIGKDPGRRKLLVFEGAGANFSYGASVQEHLPEQAGEMLKAFHLLLSELDALSIPTAAVVRGQCLGGGLELAAWCGRVFCEPAARFGVPEVKLAVFPPIGAIVLPWRAGGAAATEMILSGESVGGEEAARLRVADVCTADPEAALRDWFTKELEPKSAIAVRMAWLAVRLTLGRRLLTDLPVLEKLYLEVLMRHRDPVEGLQAFLEKRTPAWEDR
jgi:cyclohexa-1,5-dienecarbonyl-CoA hydratase